MWSATHRITFIPADGSAPRSWTVMQCKDPHGAESALGVTQDEWTKARPPLWRCDLRSGRWTWMGHPTPYGQPGRIEVEVEAPAAQPTTVRYARRRAPLHAAAGLVPAPL